MEHARRADDHSLAADLLWQSVPDLLSTGRRRILEGWLRTFSDRELLAQPQLSLATAWCALEAGRQVEPWVAAADRAVEIADPPRGASSLEASRLLLKATLGADGLAATAAAAQAAYAVTAPDDPWRCLACYVAGTALQLQGDSVAGARRIEEGEQLSRLLAVPTVHALCLAQRSLLAFENNEWEMMQASAGRALDLVHRHRLNDLATMVPVFAAVALSQAHDKRREEAQRTARHAARLLSYIAPRIPWVSLEVRILLARAYLMLGDAPAARTVLAEAQSTLDRIVDAPLLIRRLEEAWSLVTSAPLSTEVGPSSLTTAELRVLHLLPTHLSFQEIGNALFLSRNTVKTQAISAYRKLGVSSRGEAVERARSLGLLGRFPSSPGD
jgi:LuxR family maltose regulon positive regulatory protein